MNLQHVDMVFQLVVFLFAISVHESAHAWMANRCGDPTAKMLGRITLNPLKHIDPIGTVLLPAIGLLTGAGLFGWAKPCPVTPDNFKDPVKGDILTTVAGPVSNFLLVSFAMTSMAIISLMSADGREIVKWIATGMLPDTNSVFLPVVLLLYNLLFMNVLLGIFNLIPIPPLDGSHILRHMLPPGIRNVYDSMGIVGFILAFTVGGFILGKVMRPVMRFLNMILFGLGQNG